MANIFATGTTGTIGKHLGSSIGTIDIDLSDNPNSFNSISFDENMVIIHAAAVVGVEKVIKDINYSHRVNVLGTINLARVALKSNISKFVLVSTSHVYAKSNRLLFEHSKVSPLSEYAEQKLQAEQAITEMFKDFPTKLCIVRVFSVLDWDTPQYTLGDTVRKIVLGDPNAFVRFVDDIRDFLTPKQVANSLIKIAKTENLTGIVNLSSAQGMTVFDAVSVMLELAGVGLKADLLHRGKSEIPRIVGSNSKLKNQIPDLELSWSPSPFKS